jgi:hypothetical protein
MEARHATRRKAIVTGQHTCKPDGEITRRAGHRPIGLRNPCFAQALGNRPWLAVERIRSTHGACGENVVFFTPRCMISQPRSGARVTPVKRAVNRINYDAALRGPAGSDGYASTNKLRRPKRLPWEPAEVITRKSSDHCESRRLQRP